MKVSEEIVIKKKFQQFMVPLSLEELEQLKENIIAYGCKDPLVAWINGDEKILIDGHNRYEICTKNGIDFKVNELKFDSEEKVTQWIINNQIGRRNLTSDQMSYYRGLKYLKLKKKKGGYDKVVSEGANENTSELLSQEFNVGPATIRRDANFAQGIEIVGESNPQLRLDILQGKTKIPKKDIQFLANLEMNDPKFSNEADLYNQLHFWKEERLNGIENSLKEVKLKEPATEEDLFPSSEERIKKIKSLIISYMNNAIENKNPRAINKLREIIDQLEAVIIE